MKTNKERKKKGKDLLYYLDLYSELSKRGTAQKATEWLESEINGLVEDLKK